ncbi:imelysin family protein [Hyunsoonleella pacifica]|uniref:Imelysin-like domain-containing protein n=1 Tax=Hyunsoonleella pacifica TaxID=1080224 RepID=A0A4Q9FVR2_9FLAO|nr:imelysin family protein [Hyunsoonleella pacifica]TBN18572.1 hypothetical protein EYD46_00450 [Hyunsoonleella pacifica]GGD02915.1 iron-regulated protein A precursor [Hyunsoonleella pacifica]
MKKIKYLIPVIIGVFVFACSSSSDDGNDGGDNGDNFNRVSLTSGWVDNLLLPAVNDLKSKVESLNASVIAFADAPDANTLSQARADLFEAAKVWQHVEMFFYGGSYALDMYSYPTEIDKITDNINSDIEVNLDRTVLNKSQGLPALDYLLNGVEVSDNEIIAKYQDAKYVAYIKRLTSRIVTLTDQAITDFEVTKADNLNSIDDTKTSYFSIQVNDFVQYTEKSFREAKIATPSGTRNRDIFPNISVSSSPESVESLYSPENSKALYLEAYDAIQDFYYGRSYSNNANTTGLQEYLQSLGTTIMVDGADMSLDVYIVQLFGNIDAANNNITDNFYLQTQDYNPNFDAAFDAIQDFVVAIKSNAINAFNLTIDFVDSDGD